MSGPLAGIRIVEMDAIGPVPFCAMLLADMGADVVHIARPRGPSAAEYRNDVLSRSRRSVAVNVKDPAGIDTVRALAREADAFIEGNRPGVMERLGLGPDVLLGDNPRLVYGRMTGWGQDGPLAKTAGHDINYIALAGVLHGIGRAGERPVPPLNLVGDYGGGAMFLAFGVVCALLEARRSGRGQVVDAAMVDGAAYLMAIFHGMLASGAWRDQRGVNLLDSGAPWYDVYECADGQHVAVGALEAPFYAQLVATLGLAGLPDRNDRANWPALRERFAAEFRTRTRDEWAALFAPTDACVSPILSMAEAPQHQHNAARGTFIAPGGISQAAPAPRFSRTPGTARAATEISAQDLLAEWQAAKGR